MIPGINNSSVTKDRSRGPYLRDTIISWTYLTSWAWSDPRTWCGPWFSYSDLEHWTVTRDLQNH